MNLLISLKILSILPKLIKIILSISYINMSEQIDNLEEDTLQELKDPSSPKEKDRESRSSVRKELREQRQLFRDLRRRLKGGENLSGDIEACEGQIELLYKELQSIEERWSHYLFGGKRSNCSQNELC